MTECKRGIIKTRKPTAKYHIPQQHPESFQSLNFESLNFELQVAAMTPNQSEVLVLLNNSHVSEFWLSPDEDVPDPLDLYQLPFDVIHGNGGVCHGHHLLFWERETEKERDRLLFFLNV